MGVSLQLPEGSSWRTAIRVALLLLSEDAIIAMLKDAPIEFLAATAVMPLLAVVALETHDKIKPARTWPLTIILTLLLLVYGTPSKIEPTRPGSRPKTPRILAQLKSFYDEANTLLLKCLTKVTTDSDLRRLAPARKNSRAGLRHGSSERWARRLTRKYCDPPLGRSNSSPRSTRTTTAHL